ncbi:helix-turn-helix domain-containing protein [Catenulispora sp. NL8]|uniref:Helix-turn-helix domain-containing protein n=1 Tax=Catenulispora pinistramenti TaxID=2705254 RepID=A0ABS5KY88_9ACTN|nr:helix-turn-helix domain-containing protein [Catenulispora pinistramenti]MBS2551022.1 helix-turn-helix domain-containing protein [Catenulispora pinistramenti]
MPGGRLTYADRGQIAAWLADGLGYAEIGRRLGRPTSTVSREVARNGGFGAYVADDAQRTAGGRARRRKPDRPDGSGPDGWPDERVRGFAESFATVLAGTGLPRMTSRVFVCLLTADADGLTAAELVRRLRVSPASVSKSIGYLETVELVARRSDPGERRERYLIGDDVWGTAWRADTGAHGEVAAAAQQGLDILGSDTAAGLRLGRMGRFFGQLSEQMHGSGLAEGAVHDALTLVAALVHAGRPVGIAGLADALAWSEARVRAAVEANRGQPAIADPLVLQDIGAQEYAVVARSDRLSAEQREAIEKAGAQGSPQSR